jgi:hypothetical protein
MWMDYCDNECRKADVTAIVNLAKKCLNQIKRDACEGEWIRNGGAVVSTYSENCIGQALRIIKRDCAWPTRNILGVRYLVKRIEQVVEAESARPWKRKGDSTVMVKKP